MCVETMGDGGGITEGKVAVTLTPRGVLPFSICRHASPQRVQPEEGGLWTDLVNRSDSDVTEGLAS